MNLKLCFFFLFFFSLHQFSIRPLQSLIQKEQLNKTDEKTDQQTKSTKNTQEKIKLTPQQEEKLGCFIIAAAIIASEPSLFIKTYLRNLCWVVCHELGHALAGKLLWGDQISIGIGDSKARKKPLFKNNHLRIESWYPGCGYANWTSIPIEIDSKTNQNKINPETNNYILKNKKRYGIAVAAGPICGIIGHLLFSLLEAKISKKPFKFYEYGIAEQLFHNLLISDGKFNDAFQLWEKCFNKKTPKKMAALHPNTMTLFMSGCLFKNLIKNSINSKDFKTFWQYFSVIFTKKEKEFLLHSYLLTLSQENTVPTVI